MSISNENVNNDLNTLDLFIETPLGKKAIDTFSTVFSNIIDTKDVNNIMSFLHLERNKYQLDTNNYKYISLIINCVNKRYPGYETMLLDKINPIPSFISAFKKVAITQMEKQKTENIQLGETTNGDINYVDMGSEVWCLFMEMSNKNVMDPPIKIKGTGTNRKGQEPMKTNFMDKLPYHIKNNCITYMKRIFSAINCALPSMQPIYLDTLWRLVFFERGIVNQKRMEEGKGNKDIFYLLFTLIAKEMPKSAINMCHLIPHYGSMKDIRYLLIHYLNMNNMDMITALSNVFINSIDMDIRMLSPDNRGILSSKGSSYTISEYKEFISNLCTCINNMTPEQIKKEFNNLVFSMAGKYWPSEDGKYSNATIRNEKRNMHGKTMLPELRKRPFSQLDNLLTSRLFFPNDGIDRWSTLEEGSKSFYLMLSRKTKTVLNKILDTVEVRMASNQWKYINPKTIPGKAFFQHRLAFLNETVGTKVEYDKTETGNRSTDIDRIDLRKRTLISAEKGELKSGGDSTNFAKVLMENNLLRIDPISISSAMRTTLNAQFNNLVEDTKVRLETEYNKKREQWIAMGSNPDDEPLNPFYCAFITDVSSSMGNRIYNAVVNALIGIKLSKLTKGSITFSSKPSFILLDDDGDFISWFHKIATNSNWGGSTNIESAFKMMLNMMKSVRAIDPTFNGKVSLTVLTDMMFNPTNGETGPMTLEDYDKCMTEYENKTYYNSHQKPTMPQRPFVERMTKMFNDEGFNVPLVCYWNMNGNTKGFGVQADSPGIISVEGLNSGMLMSALGGGVEFKKNNVTGITTASTNPLISFLKRLSKPDYDKVSEQLYITQEGPFASNVNVARNKLFFAFNTI